MKALSSLKPKTHQKVGGAKASFLPSFRFFLTDFSLKFRKSFVNYDHVSGRFYWSGKMEKINLDSNSQGEKRKFRFNWQKILLYYSTSIITISFIGGIISIREPKDFVLNLLFLPIVAFLWITLIQKRKQSRTSKKVKNDSEIKKNKILRY